MTLVRFWSKVDKSGECWLWTGSRQTSGYGQVRVAGRCHPAHRFSYEIAHGPITDSGLYVCHRCDNPLCVRPDHLFLGTPTDNIHDMMTKGRQNMTGQSKLSAAERDEIRTLAATGQHSQRALAQQFGVTQATINRVIGQRQRAQVKLTREDARIIRQLAASRITQREIAKRFGASQAHISNIVRGLAWPDA